MLTLARVRNRTRAVLARLGRGLARLDAVPSDVGATTPTSDEHRLNERYVESPPSVENAVALFDGEWSTKLPVETPTGFADLIDDHRITSCVGALGGVEGARVLELGPLEGAHSATLRSLGATSVVAIEANTGAFLRCLVTKEILGLDGVEFRLGDFRPILADCTERFDLAVAVGVLYHLDDPVPVLANLARLTDRMVIWSHVFDDAAGMEHFAARFDPPETRELEGIGYRLHPYRYEESLDWKGFSGGTRPIARWIERGDLLEIVDGLGFDVVLRDDHDHPHGPAMTLALRRRPEG
mgnify:FL=1